MSVEALDSTRVSRIKPGYLNNKPEGRTRFATAPTTTLNPDTSELIIPGDQPVETKVFPTLSSVIKEENPFCEKPYSCLNCTAYRLCVPSIHGLVELYSGLCPGDRPYCDNYSGTCVSSVSAAVKCGNPDESFHCMQDGHFPHPIDSARYFICSGFKAYGYSCKEGLKYYAPSQGCSRFPWIADPFDCSDLNATKVLYNNGGSVYAYCVNGKPFLVNNCANGELLNLTSQVCEPQCNKEFIAPDRNNCKNYFKCSKNPKTNLFEKSLMECPNGEGFNGGFKKCVPLNQLVNC